MLNYDKIHTCISLNYRGTTKLRLCNMYNHVILKMLLILSWDFSLLTFHVLFLLMFMTCTLISWNWCVNEYDYYTLRNLGIGVQSISFNFLAFPKCADIQGWLRNVLVKIRTVTELGYLFIKKTMWLSKEWSMKIQFAKHTQTTNTYSNLRKQTNE